MARQLGKRVGRASLRSGGIELNEVALDWVTCAPLLRRRAKLRARQAEEAAPEQITGAEEVSDELDTSDNDGHAVKIPTQIALCEFLRFLEYGLKKGRAAPSPCGRARHAWDRLDPEKRVQGPMVYLRSQYPMFAGRLEDIETLEVKTFGVSVASGDLEDPEFKKKFYEKGLHEAGYIVIDENSREFLSDLTLPISWVMKI